MKLQIEKWIENTKPFSDSANELFMESINNYKFGSYRSAFIMAYLSFKCTIRDRIINCTYGSELKKKNPNFWKNEILSKLENDDIWENQINDIVIASCEQLNNRKELGILNFENALLAKTEYNYWKEKRNACVHGKNQIIDSSTVESFWNYLIDNLSQFYVLGGEEYLKRELVEIYNYYKYPEISNKSKMDGLLNDISTVYKDRTKEFFERFICDIDDINCVDADNCDFWSSIIHSSQKNIIDGFIMCISTKRYMFFELYYFFPKLLEMLVSFEPKFIIETLSKWLEEFPFRNIKADEIFWRVLVDSLDKYGEWVKIDQIVTERTFSLIKRFSGKDNDVAILNKHGVFKKYLLEISAWYFKTDSKSQFDNFEKYFNDFSKVELCFYFLQWDIDCLNRLEGALETLNQSAPARENIYSKINASDAMRSFELVICTCREKIKAVAAMDWSRYELIHKVIEKNESV